MIICGLVTKTTQTVLLSIKTVPLTIVMMEIFNLKLSLPTHSVFTKGLAYYVIISLKFKIIPYIDYCLKLV